MSQSESTNSEGKPRELLLKTDGIPETTQNRIIIPPNQSLTSFSRVSYHEEYCKDFISKNEFDEIIDNACKLASLAYSQKRENDDRKLPSRVMLSFWIACIQTNCIEIAYLHLSLGDKQYKYLYCAFVIISFIHLDFILEALSSYPKFAKIDDSLQYINTIRCFKYIESLD